MFEKSGRVFCWHTVKREPVPIRVLNPKACGVQGRRPDGGCRAAKPPTKKKSDISFFQKYFFSIQKQFFFIKIVWNVCRFFGFFPLKDMQTLRYADPLRSGNGNRMGKIIKKFSDFYFSSYREISSKIWVMTSQKWLKMTITRKIKNRKLIFHSL